MSLLTTQINQLLSSNELNSAQIDHEIDKLLLLDYSKIEHAIEGEPIKDDPNLYARKDLRAEALYTSYQDFQNIAKALPLLDNQSFVDLGSGMSRSKLFLDIFYPNSTIWALEKSSSRIEAAKRSAKAHGLSTDLYINCDLMNYEIPLADYYFIYLPSGSLLERIMKCLEKLAIKKKIKIIAIESHGDLILNIKENYPWLKERPLECQTSTPRHDSKIYLFESLEPIDQKQWINEKEFVFNKLYDELKNNRTLLDKNIPSKWKHLFYLDLKANENTDFMINSDDDEEIQYWLGSTQNFQLSLYENQYELKYPNRHVLKEHIHGVILPNEKIEILRKKRFTEEVISSLGKIRKIIKLTTRESYLIEFSNGKRIPFNQLPQV